MASITREDVKKFIREAPMLELAELVKEIEEEFGDKVEVVTYIKGGQQREEKPSPEYLAVIQQGYKDWGIL